MFLLAKSHIHNRLKTTLWSFNKITVHMRCEIHNCVY